MSSFSHISDYRERVMGCWLGKAVGGTLGMPFEGADGPFDLRFYDPVPTEMLPNDDLDLQVLWACVLDKMDPVRVDRHVLGQAWLKQVDFPWDEYGVAIRNLRNGLQPPLTGSYDNWFAGGMGAAIRSEVWACLAPGNPQLAAAYAYEDACVDHAGEGIWAEVFLASLESAAFGESDPHKLLDQALLPLPVTSLVRRAVNDTRLWWEQTHDWQQVRQWILRDYGHENFTDVTMNLAFIVLGWRAGQGDFSRSICIAANCGKDTDCTGATVGALLGILNPAGIGEDWLKPIGRQLVINKDITGITPPSTLDGFTDLVLDLRKRLNGQPPTATTPVQATDHLGLKADVWFGKSPADHAANMPPNMRTVTLPGMIGVWPYEKFAGPYMFLRYHLRLSQPQKVRVLFNTHEDCVVWLDGRQLFARESGRLAPSFHRVPVNQFADVELAAGAHQLTAAIRKPAEPREIQWIVGVGDAKNHQWLTHTIQRSQ